MPEETEKVKETIVPVGLAEDSLKRLLLKRSVQDLQLQPDSEHVPQVAITMILHKSLSPMCILGATVVLMQKIPQPCWRFSLSPWGGGGCGRAGRDRRL